MDGLIILSRELKVLKTRRSAARVEGSEREAGPPILES